MSEEEKKENQQEEEEIDQEKLAEEWAKMAQQSEQESAQQEPEEETVDQEALAKEWEQMAQQSAQEQAEEESVDQDKLAEEWAKMAEESQPQEELAKEWEQSLQEQPSQQPPIQQVEGFDQQKLELLMDIPLEISVEIGSTTMPLEEVLKLNPNSIVELDRYINQPVDIKVNGKLIAKGELYTVENNFGIKITSIITVQERMKLLTDEES
ncbi:flagellar motor switch protein FliN [Persephonella sp.]